jgi:hypothetical protein
MSFTRMQWKMYQQKDCRENVFSIIRWHFGKLNLCKERILRDKVVILMEKEMARIVAA